MFRTMLLLVVVWLAVGSRQASAEDSAVSNDEIRAAVTRSLPLLAKGAQGSMEQRKQCFTCHNQGLPILALTTAKSRGFEVDAEHLGAQLKFTAEFIGKNKTRYLEGKGQGGAADTAGYALWTLENGGWKPDDTTAAVAEYFLQFQKDADHWQPVSRRPPSEFSHFTTNFLAIRGLKAFGVADQRERIDARLEQVRSWLVTAEANDTEDRVFRLRALRLVGAADNSAADDAVKQATAALLKSQREDGGWGQIDDMASDAYATGSALVALHEAGGVKADDPAYRKGLRYLIGSQQEDGSWHVVSRSKPFQAYFESGYPHGKDQFISIAGGSWATTALVLALPRAKASDATPAEKAATP